MLLDAVAESRGPEGLPGAWNAGRWAQVRGRLPGNYVTVVGAVDAAAISRRLRSLADRGWVRVERGRERLVFSLSEEERAALSF